jgi:hypothetical protein
MTTATYNEEDQNIHHEYANPSSIKNGGLEI